VLDPHPFHVDPDLDPGCEKFADPDQDPGLFLLFHVKKTLIFGKIQALDPDQQNIQNPGSRSANI